MEPAPHIAVVDDHREIRELVSRYLLQHGYRVSAAPGAREFRQLFERSVFDLVVLDIMMPGEDGLALCRQLRATCDLPIILLTAMTEETDRIIGLEMGADDYVSKPFNPRELLARIKTVLRRANSLPPRHGRARAEIVRLDRWTVDLGRRELIGEDGVAVPLSTAEFRLLCAFLDHPGTILTRVLPVEEFAVAREDVARLPMRLEKRQHVRHIGRLAAANRDHAAVSRVRNPVAFGRRCIPPGGVARRSNIPDILAPCQPGASPPSMRHGISDTGHVRSVCHNPASCRTASSAS